MCIVFFFFLYFFFQAEDGIRDLVRSRGLGDVYKRQGFIFVMTGAIFSHIACGDGAFEFFGPSLLIILTIVSWYYLSLIHI